MRARRWGAVAAVVTSMVLAGCGDDGPPSTDPVTSTVPDPSSSTVAPDGTVPSTTAAPDLDDTATPRPPLTNAAGENEAFSGIGQLDGFGTSCTAFLLDVGEPSGPAYALTNGHCVGIFDSTSVVRDLAADGAVVRFRSFVDTPSAVAEVPVAAVRYGTMRGTDVAVLELGVTRSAVIGLASYALARPPADGDEIRVVGVPVSGVPDGERVLRGDTCTAGWTVRLVEFEWLWDAAVASDCAGILGGNSGSPVFDAADPTRVVGIVNTTTIGAAPGVTCWLGQPCEVAEAGATTQLDRTYAMPVAAWDDCFAPAWDPTVAGCPVEPAPVVVDAPARAVRPGATWSATISGGGGAYVAKAGPAGTTDCRVGEGYAPSGASFDDVLPAADGVYVLSAASVDARGRPSTAQAGIGVMVVDGTPPDTPIVLSQSAQDDGIRVEPIFAPPEHSSYELKVGPVADVDCADADGYSIYRRVPIVVDAADLPATMCVVGEDEAGNKGAAQSFELS